MLRRLGLLMVGLVCLGDEVSGPGRDTLQRTPWGSFYLERATLGAHRVLPSNGDLRIQSSQGEVVVSGGLGGDFRLRCGSDQLTVRSGVGTLDVQWGSRLWSLRRQAGRLALEATEPRDRVVFERNGEDFTIKGARGFLEVRRRPGVLALRSSAGEATFTSGIEGTSASGQAPERMPYVGRGLYLTFHGVGLFVDLEAFFPMPELAAWTEGRSILDPLPR